MIAIELVDKLVDRILQIYKYHKESKRQLFEDYITPIYTEFKKLHKNYLKSFNNYRNLIKSLNQLCRDSDVIDNVATDNLFYAHYRINVYQLATIAIDKKVGPFVTSIYKYLVDPLLTNVVDPLEILSLERRPEDWKSVKLKDLDVLKTQYFRTSLHSRLTTIADESWTSILDPECSGPPLDKNEIIHEQELLYTKYNIDQNNPKKIERLKIALALEEVDNLVFIMQSAYQNVEIEFNALKKKIYLKKKI